MTTARPTPDNRPLGFQQPHARRYLETGGEDGHVRRTPREIPLVILERA